MEEEAASARASADGGSGVTEAPNLYKIKYDCPRYHVDMRILSLI